jgi:hypothetical protein
MKSVIRIAIAVSVAVAVVALWGQAGGVAANKEQAVAQLKQSVAANRAKLMKYQWVQNTQVSLKGEVRKDTQSMCRYGPDGKVVKTPMGPPPEPQDARGVKGRVIAKKKAEMQDYGEQLKSLIGEYVPPDPQMMQASKQQGNASVAGANGIMALTFKNYYKPGDQVVIGFDPSTKKIASFDVNTYMSDTSDVVTLANQFASLPDGTNYVAKTVVNAQSKQMVITTTNSNYTPAQ